MADKTHIQWTDRTFNVVSGCTKISDGCLSCYIERTIPFRVARRRFDKPGIGGTTGVILHENRLTQPMRWRDPSLVFVCSLADLFHDEVPTQFIARLFAVMVACPQHSFQILTKRQARLAALLTSESFWQMVSEELGALWNTAPPTPLRQVPAWIWIGVSVESQEWADRRIPTLLKVPAAVRWLSCEPLLGPVSLARWLSCCCPATRGPDFCHHAGCPVRDGRGLSWMVVGGESGPGAQPMAVDWARDLVRQCADAGVAPFVKQLGTAWARNTSVGGQLVSRTDIKGGDWQHWPADLRIREYPRTAEAVAGA